MKERLPEARFAGRSTTRYQVLLELGQGGMGVIHIARAVGAGGFERLVVVKRMHAHLMTNPSATLRFLDEATVAAQVHHANVVGIHRVGTDDAGHYLVLDYVEGDSLDGLIDRSMLKRQPVQAPIALRVILDALCGLRAVHDAADSSGKALGILHRDVSVQNILVGRDGVARLTDFGIAKSELAKVSTDARYLVGKLLYSPPEYLRNRATGRRMDVYAMGLCLWIALAGPAPWPDCTEEQLLQAILGDGVPPLSAAGVQVAPAIQAILDRSCASNPDERFSSAQEFIDALEEVGRYTGWIASQTEVAAWMENLVGPDLARRRQMIASAAQRLAPDRGTDPLTDPESAPAASSRGARLGLARRGGIAGLLVGIGAIGLTLATFVFWPRTRSTTTIEAAASPSPARAEISSSPPQSAAPIESTGNERDAGHVAVSPGEPSRRPPLPSTRVPVARPPEPARTSEQEQITTSNPYR